ncbi:hypothetical protein DFH09DRAFT_1407102 [Mycena vulgaris]|nr:hypothetical protein DFH09DRAFT_1407102 [Mycena vulgaris]
MASTSNATPYSRPMLPGIHEMFPDHLPPLPSNSRPRARAHAGPASRSPLIPTPPALSAHSVSFDVLKSHPRATSLLHIASSRMPAHPAPSSSCSSDGDADAEGEMEDPEEGEGEGLGRKHVCGTCGKRFNRPSSLRIHANTHTGATPFKCPYPSCGRAFNVNSNMRRHYRNHGSPAFTPLPPAPVPAQYPATSYLPLSLSPAPYSPSSPAGYSPYSPASSAYSPSSPASYSPYAAYSPASSASYSPAPRSASSASSPAYHYAPAHASASPAYPYAPSPHPRAYSDVRSESEYAHQYR